MLIRERICPICEKNNKEKLFSQQFAYIKKISFMEKYDVVLCKQCGFIYADGIPTQDEFDKYYEKNSKYENWQEDISKDNKKRYIDTMHFCENTLRNDNIEFRNMKIVDVGCSTGEFLRFLKKRGFHNLYGIDPSEICVEYLKKCGVEGTQKTISVLDENSKYDFVRLNAVLEHIQDLNASIVQLKKLMHNKSYLYISVPNVDGFYKTNNCPYQEFSTEHINYFSIASLKNLMNKHGLKLKNYSINTNEKFSEIEAIFSLTELLDNNFDERGFESVKYLNKYLELSEEIEKKVYKKIQEYVQSKEKIIVWGVGTFTLRQLQTGALKFCNIDMFVDSNMHYQNTQYGKIPVCAPERIKENFPILVASYFAYDSIVKYARENLKLSNKIVSIFE